MRRYLVIALILLPVMLVLLPSVIVLYISPGDFQPTVKKGKDFTQEELEQQIPIKVYRTKTKQVEQLPLERYIEGVVAAEMPAEFQLEALKAQAMAARTYIVRRLQEGDFSDVPEGAYVLDTVKHQVYLNEEERKEQWKSDFAWKNAKIREAVYETAGIILSYQGEPIEATFFSVSNGYTENAEDYWNVPLPYLKSVESPWDRQSPKFQRQISFPVEEVERKLGVRLHVSASTKSDKWYKVLKMTDGQRIGLIEIGGKSFTGRQVRELLGLPSTAFTMKLASGRIFFLTKGYGHGVGMSQWGAQGMAEQGKSAEEIVKHYYRGIELKHYNDILKEAPHRA